MAGLIRYKSKIYDYRSSHLKTRDGHLCETQERKYKLTITQSISDLSCISCLKILQESYDFLELNKE